MPRVKLMSLICKSYTASQIYHKSPGNTSPSALVIKEALRYHPAVALTLERVVPLGGLQLSSHYIPANTIVGMSAWVLHRDPAVFGHDANVFRPERWEVGSDDVSNEKIKKMDRSFFAFGAGARTCIGKNISLMEMGKFVPQFLREFEIEWAGGAEWTVRSSWFGKQSNVLVRLRSRGKKDT
jgi:cytochrome P450